MYFVEPDEITLEYLTEKKRAASKLRYQRIKNDPVKYERLKIKERERYQRRKREGQVKSVKEMSLGELQEARDNWRKNTRKRRSRLAKQNMVVLPDLSCF